MVTVADLRAIAHARRDDAQVLMSAARYDGAVYLCGYAVEVALKARVCQALGWAGYPATRGEFDGYQSFRTHDLDVLLHLSGVESTIKTQRLAEWSVLATWDPSARYRPIGSASPQEAADMLSAVTTILAVL